MNKIIILFLLFCFGATSAVANGHLSGNISDEQGVALGQFTVTVNGTNRISGKDGRFSGRAEYDDMLMLEVAAEGYYTIRHTFIAHEFKINAKGGIVIPPIRLVARKEGRVMLAFGGDVMMARRFVKPRAGEPVLIHKGHESRDTKEIVKHIKPYFDLADYGSVNLESQVMAAKPKGSAPKSITFFSPPETVEALAWAGVDYVTLGNNHTYDNLQEGLVSTRDILARSPLGYSGAGLNEKQALQAYRTSISGIPYSFLGYVGWKGSSRPHQAAEGKDKGGAALGTMGNIMNTVGREAGEHTTIVQYHGSLEYSDEPTLVTEQKLKSAIDRGADLAIAHHPHVTQGFEIYKDRLIAYSLGNFIFDQYYYATQFSYLLYVWMDGEKFLRAEIVPLYIKGYKPTPAVGAIRRAILKRVASLSARRNIGLEFSGGHGVITRKPPIAPQKFSRKITLTENQILSLDQCGPAQYVTGLTSANGHIQYRLGQELLRRGDFEGFDSFASPERGWLPQNEGSGSEIFQGNNVHKVAAESGQQKSLFGMKIFTRVYKAGNPMTFAGQVYGTAETKLDFYMQTRPSRWGLKKSLETGPKQKIGMMTLAKGGWQEFSFDFNTPRVGVHSFRILVEASGQDDEQVAPLYYDDVALIEWQTAFQNVGNGHEIAAPNQVTHLDVRGITNVQGRLEIMFSDLGNTGGACHME